MIVLHDQNETRGSLGDDGDILSGAQKRFLEYPSRSVRQSRVAAKHTSGTPNSGGLPGNVGHSRAACCLQIVKFFLLIQGIHLVLQSPDLRQEPIHRRRFFFLLVKKFICSQQSGSFRLFTANSPVISDCPSNLVHDSLEKVNFSSTILQIFCI